MPNTIPSEYLKNNYNEISELCRKSAEPITITKSGKNDLIILSIEAYDKLCIKAESFLKMKNNNNKSNGAAISKDKKEVYEQKYDTPITDSLTGVLSESALENTKYK